MQKAFIDAFDTITVGRFALDVCTQMIVTSISLFKIVALISFIKQRDLLSSAIEVGAALVPRASSNAN